MFVAVMANTYADRVEALRRIMRERDWDAIIIPGADPHLSEYLAPRWKQVEWVSGFTAETADLVITLDHAGLWTDSRYFIQARKQLSDTGIELHKTRVPEQVLIPEWLADHFGRQQEIVIALDSLCVSSAFVDSIVSRLAEEGTQSSIAGIPNLLDSIWKDRPAVPRTRIFQVETGESRGDKIDWLRSFLSEQCSAAILISALDEIAWMLNVRASDIEYNPLVISYLLVTEDRVCWYVLKDGYDYDEERELFSELASEGVEILPYGDIELDLSGFDLPVCLDPDAVSYELSKCITSSVIPVQSPVAARKAVKNVFEVNNIRKAHLLDGVVMERFLYWLEHSVEAQTGVTEYDAARKLYELRSEVEGFCGESFETISAYGEGAALPHYVTPHVNAPVLFPEGLYLCDSGAQYEFGTTDITRTVPLGRCTRTQQEDYTLVLKCHIDLAMAIWPAGTPGCRLDALAREPLWRYKRNFGHGTGHGVGYFLGVHEGPHDIRQNLNPVPLTPGMIVSDEPAIYREGEFGIRHENLLLVRFAGTNAFGSWLRFETLTICHFDTSIIIKELLNADEIKWLNDYNEMVYNTLSDRLPRSVAAWLKEKTAAI